MSNNVNTHILKDLFNLVFFSGKGSEIYMQKEYTIEWEFVPAIEYNDNFLSVPKGFIAGEVSEPNEDEDDKIPHLLSLIIGITDGGKFTHNSLNTNYSTLFGDCERQGILNSNHKAKIRFKLNNQTKPLTFELPLHDDGDLFSFTFDDLRIATSNSDKKYGYVKQITIEQEQYLIDKLEENFKNLAFYFPFIKYVGDYYQEPVSTGFIASDTFLILSKNNEGKNKSDIFHRPHIGEYTHDHEAESEFAPYIDVTQTIEGLDDTTNASSTTGGLLFGGATLNQLSRTFQLVFQPTNNSEIFIIDHDVNYNLLWNTAKNKEYAVDLFNVEEQYANNPITFAVGFKSQTEGCYQNFLGIYLRNLDNNQSFFMGVLNIKTTVEGEDERFRTLLSNFGIPDPVKYSNIFKDVDYEEEGYDYRVINKKSKELFLTYDKIFSYVGTYKALLNAVKFLGYSDIVFKEWYKFRDVDNNLHNLAVRRIDLSSENYIKFHDEYGIDFEKYINYTKLNKLTMIYHLNELSEDPLYIKYKQHFVIDGQDVYQTLYMYDMLDNVVPIYELRNDEILAKLFGIKEWLEAHIIGVGAYISDISGEGLYVGGVKTQLYSTMHHLADYHEEEYVTPVITNISEFKVFADDAHTQILDDQHYGATAECTLTEYTGLTFEDYKNVSFGSFERVTVPVDINGETYNLKIGNPIETPVLFDEIEYSIDVSNCSGTVTEFNSINKNNNNSEFFVNDGEITLLTTDFLNSNDTLKYFIAKNYKKLNIITEQETCEFNAPTIFIETGTIRDPENSSWTDNVIYSINEELSESGEVYNVKNVITGETVDISPKTIILKPHTKNTIHINPVGNVTEYIYADFEYTMNNNFNVPVIMVSGYDIIVNDTIINPGENGSVDKKIYIIDIVTGRIEFYKQKDTSDYKLKTEVFFSDDNRYDENDLLKFVENPRELVVKIKYEYIKDRQQLITYDKLLTNRIGQGLNPDDIAFNGTFDSFNDVLQTLEDITNINAKTVNMQINRTGTYTVKAKTYNKYNNIFTSKSDKEYLVETQPIDVNVYIKNQNSSNNDKSIYPKNIVGLPVDIVEDNNIEGQYYIDGFSFNEESIKTNYHYHSENIEFDYTKPNELNYLNVTYALDTPKNNEHILLYPTKISKPYKDSEIITINNTNSNLLIKDADNKVIGIKDANDSSIRTYNIKPIINNDNGKITGYIGYMNYEYFNKNYKLSFKSSYVNDENETKCTILYISNYDDNFKIPEEETPTKVFKVGDVVKIKYEVQYLDESQQITKTFDNSICYRILNIEDNKIVINGWLDEYIIGLRKPYSDPDNTAINVNVYMSYPHEEVAYYDVEITEDADEYKDYINEIPYLKTNVKFNDRRLFLNDYLDNNYRLYLYDFDFVNFENIWWKHIDSDMYIDNLSSYYKYVNFPVTYDRGNQVLVKATDNYFVNTVPYHEWIWQTYHVQSGENYNEYNTEKTLNVLFKSTNDTLNVYPDMQGRQDIILKSVDKFGNIFKNNGEGLLFLK